MMRFQVVVSVMPKLEISDPQGQTIERALPTVGFEGIRDVRVGKRIELIVEADDEAAAGDLVDRACRKFLSNPVIEDYRADIAALESSS